MCTIIVIPTYCWCQNEEAREKQRTKVTETEREVEREWESAFPAPLSYPQMNLSCCLIMLLSQANFLHSASTCLIGRYLGWPAAFCTAATGSLFLIQEAAAVLSQHTPLYTLSHIYGTRSYVHSDVDMSSCVRAHTHMARCEPACCLPRVAFLLWNVGVKQHATPGIWAIRHTWNHGNHASCEHISKSIGKKWRRGEQLDRTKRAHTFHGLQEGRLESKNRILGSVFVMSDLICCDLRSKI